MTNHPNYHIRTSQALTALADPAASRTQGGISLAPATIKLLLSALTLAVCARDIEAIELLLNDVLSLPLTAGVVYDVHALVSQTELMWSLIWVEQPALARFMDLDSLFSLNPGDYPLSYA